MPRARIKGFSLAMLLAALGALAACSDLASSFPAGEEGGCNPQVAAAYRVLSSIQTGTLEIRVQDASGSPQASVSVTAYRLVYTGAKCPSMISGVTDGQGLLRFERMKTGPYEVSLEAATATASTEVEANKTATVTLVD
ncbi:hypothetical protein D3C86_1089970 [compost metagenome]